jgi:hypothetical protein
MRMLAIPNRFPVDRVSGDALGKYFSDEAITARRIVGSPPTPGRQPSGFR